MMDERRPNAPVPLERLDESVEQDPGQVKGPKGSRLIKEERRDDAQVSGHVLSPAGVVRQRQVWFRTRNVIGGVRSLSRGGRSMCRPPSGARNGSSSWSASSMS